YNIRIDGKSNASSVKLKITATQKVEVDSTGSLTYKYDTKSIPAGNFEVKIGSSIKQVELKPGESIPSGTTPYSKQKSQNIWIAGILAGLIISLAYIRRKKT
ncbi:MAG TPA: hypothetical protein VGK06_10055, partial [Methanosarcina sp.]